MHSLLKVMRAVIFFLLFSIGAVALPGLVGVIPGRHLSKYVFTMLAVFIGVVLGACFLAKEKRAGLVLAVTALSSLCLAVTLGDLVLRPLLTTRLYYRAHERLGQTFAEFPQLKRYQPNQRLVLQAYGDLANLAGRDELRQYRALEFVTDERGFRNLPAQGSAAFDVIALGDSFTTGLGTTQSDIWSSLLESRHQMKTYNLGFQGSPWDQFMNLQIELPHIKTHQGTVLVWLMFTGNDLFENYGLSVDPKDLLHNSGWALFAEKIRVFQERSPVKKLLSAALRPLRRPDGAHWNVVSKPFLNGRDLLFYQFYVNNRHQAYEELVALPNYSRLRDLIQAANHFFKIHQLQPIIFLAPSKAEVFSWLLDGQMSWSNDVGVSGFSKALSELCDSESLRFVDLEPSLRQLSQATYESSGELLWWYDDSHWNSTGHAGVAEIVAEQIEVMMQPIE
ncbi:MAG: SGNH/GDSL hydrolase family protein [Bdellovibrionales bacterium]|nr:SGNH/GDSL hydrolase family protein [Bdellovibrionales bacterium]